MKRWGKEAFQNDSQLSEILIFPTHSEIPSDLSQTQIEARRLFSEESFTEIDAVSEIALVGAV